MPSEVELVLDRPTGFGTEISALSITGPALSSTFVIEFSATVSLESTLLYF